MHTELEVVSSAHSGSRDEHCEAEPGRKARRSFPFAKAFRDLWEGWRHYRELWLAIGWYDIRKRYRRSLLGPFWITVSLGVFIAGLSFIYTPLLGGGNSEGYLQYVAFGFIVWQFISLLVIEACNVFIVNGPIIEQLTAPLSIYIYEFIWKNLIILVHNILLYVLIVLIFGPLPTWATLLFIPAIILVCINGVSIGMLLGTLCTRFRDIPPIVGTIVQMMFLLTPIFWRAEQMPGRQLLVVLNPFYYFIELLRQPLLGNAPSLHTWMVALGITLIGLCVAIPFFSRFHDRIAYWV
jgi:ABC-2 type transport system permease protein